MFDLSTIKNGMTRSFGRGSLLMQKHSPEILLGAGLIGMVAAAVMASKATLKAEKIVSQHKGQMALIETDLSNNQEDYNEEAAAKEKAMAYVQTGLKFAKLYGPAVSVGALSVTAILASHGVMKNRQVALLALYNLTKEGYEQYRARVAEELGADVDRNFHLGLKDEKYTEHTIDEKGEKVSEKKIRQTSIDPRFKSIYSRFFDESSPMWRSDALLNKAFLTAQERYLNDILIIRGYVFLNEAYEALGLPWTKEGQLVGWVMKDPAAMKAEGRDGYISFDIYNVYNDPGRQFVNGTNPSILLDFNVDGVVLDHI